MIFFDRDRFESSMKLTNGSEEEEDENSSEESDSFFGRSFLTIEQNITEQNENPFGTKYPTNDCAFQTLHLIDQGF